MNDAKQGKYATNVRTTVGSPPSQIAELASQILKAGTERLGKKGEGLHVAVMIGNDAGNNVIALDGFDDTIDAIASLIVHLEAMAISIGKKLEFNIVDE